MNLRAAIAGVLSTLAPQASPPVAPTQRRRRAKRISPQPVTITRWLQRDVESAQHLASQGDLSLAGQLYRSFQRDGVYQGLVGTRAGGLIRLPKRFTGHPAAVEYLEGRQGKPGRFNAIFPAAELALLDADGLVLGVGVGEFIEIDILDHPVFCRLDPEFLRYRWYEDRWYYQSLEGLLPITPGDGRWVLHTPGGKQDPWNRGLWPAIARAYISKEHAFLYRENWNSKLANSARYARAPLGASEPQRQGFLQRVIAWGVNTVFELPQGWEVGLVESNGKGYESFKETIADSNQEYMVALAGQIVTVTGGAGFANAGIHATIRSDLIQGDGDTLGSTLNTQAVPVVLEGHVPANAMAEMGWDTRPPANLKAEAESLSAAATAIEDCERVLGVDNVDKRSLAARFAIPIVGDLNNDAIPDEEAPQIQEEASVHMPVGSESGEAWNGLRPVVEQPAGSTQRGSGHDGKPWERTFLVDYGYLNGTTGADGEPIDCYLGPDAYAPTAWVVAQRCPDGSFDEHKVLLGFENQQTAVETYQAHVPAWAIGPVHEVTIHELRDWLLAHGDRAMRRAA